MPDPDELRKSYDRVAGDYAAEYADEMAKKPFDQQMLDWLAEKAAGRGPICDLGCGPGQVAGYLHSRGASVYGVDLSEEMVAQGRRLHPEIPFQRGDMRRLEEVADGARGGIAAFYSLIHVPRGEMVSTLRELRRVLAPGGTLLAAFHLGSETIHRDEMWGKAVSIDFAFFEREEMTTWLLEAGFAIDEVIERDPHPEVEYPSRRCYLFATRSAEAVSAVPRPASNGEDARSR
ncbi:MAG: class I SAM-dependent methyltransferase [Acidobacteriota bacterium]|nr:class I SAM-dependent methyltransferase [Acidobacteriota bacterium]